MSKCYKCGEQWTNENRVETPLLCPKCKLVPSAPVPGSSEHVHQTINKLDHCVHCGKPMSELAAPADSDFSVDDAINGLKHMADDHKCCEPFIVETISKLKQLREAVNTAIWIRDKIQDKGGFGAGLVEWRDIEAAVAPND